ncbi:unnamed protein product [Brassica oleracea var. botrytis]|uniref:(rape) hypothetical protein n=1 Tax=Brassica napus TaxID=3708 RepID=A0A816L8B9_BRANA|nr:unnamed protein product [Brassica napus]
MRQWDGHVSTCAESLSLGDYRRFKNWNWITLRVSLCYYYFRTLWSNLVGSKERPSRVVSWCRFRVVKNAAAFQIR